MTRRPRHKFCIRAFWTAIGISLGVALVGGYLLSLPPSVTPESERYGLAENHAALAAPIVAAAPPFAIVDDAGRPVVQDNARANVRLWEATIKVLGHHTPNYPQQIGDCVSFGSKNALEYLQCVQIADGANIEFHAIYPPYIYGYSRHQIGKDRVRGDGSVGAWAATGTTEGGAAANDDPGCPPYNGTTARQWGQNGPPSEVIEIARKRLVKTVSPVTTAIEGRDALCNGYPVTVASNAGFGSFVQKDGRWVGVWNTTWMHQMCAIAYDGSGGPGHEYVYIINSWGETAHKAPLQGEPPGGFWVTFRDFGRMVEQRDSWAYSSFDGFTARDLNFNVFGRKERNDRENEIRIAAHRHSLAL